MSAPTLNASSLDETIPQAEVVRWLAAQIGRAPEGADLYHGGRELYRAGVYAGAAKLLQEYVSHSGAEPPGHHLLGHALFRLHRPAEAVESLKFAVAHGFDADWQLLTELCLELQETRTSKPPSSPRSSSSPSRASAESINGATLHVSVG